MSQRHPQQSNTSWFWWVAPIPVVALVGLAFWIEYRPAGDPSAGKSPAQKDAQAVAEGLPDTDPDGPVPKLSSEQVARMMDQQAVRVHEAAGAGPDGANLLNETVDGGRVPGSIEALSDGTGESAGQDEEALENASLSKLPPRPEFEKLQACQVSEVPGAGPNETSLSREDWKRVLKVFYGAKGILLAWLREYRPFVGETSADRMEARLRKVMVEMPPASAEPDLSWRGIAVMAENDSEQPVVRMGSGFVALAKKDMRRAAYEMTRTLAHAWSPCELEKAGAEEVWNPLLSCLGITGETGSCVTGSYSEGGWAISTLLASMTAPADCVAPAFKEADSVALKCFDEMPLPNGARVKDPFLADGEGPAQGSDRVPASVKVVTPHTPPDAPPAPPTAFSEHQKIEVIDDPVTPQALREVGEGSR